MRRAERAALWGALVAAGFSALALQVVWHRVVALHVGADVVATALVVSAFLAGLGFGNLIGGKLADRMSGRDALRWMAGAEAGVALVAAVSMPLFHDLPKALPSPVASGTGGFLLTFATLLIPTTLMGLSLPLAARAVTTRAEVAGREVGRLYAVNTAGGAAGALVGGWVLVGSLGFARTTWVCAGIGVSAAAVLAVLASYAGEGARPASRPARPAADDGADAQGGPVLRWYALYGLSGALALGLQQLFFRFVSAVGRSNSYTFSTVLALYLGVFALGTMAGARRVGRFEDPRRAYFALQFGVGATALGSLIVVTEVLPASGLAERFSLWFNTDGFASGYDLGNVADVLLFGVLLPALVVGPPVFLMGASFPFVERLVVDRLGAVGRRTGGLIAANTFGNVAGALLTAFVLFDLFGTAGSYRMMAVALMAAGLAAAWLWTGPLRRALLGAGVMALAVALVLLSPSNQRLWEFISGDPGGNGLLVAEDAECVSVVERHGSESFQLNINGASQNGYPFDDFHVLIGLVPTLMAEDPDDGLAIGFGIGSTSYAMLADDRRERVTSVELCGGHYDATSQLASEGHREFVTLEEDPRHAPLVGDGRHHLLETDRRHDVVVVDTLRVTSANSGHHFSVEFYDLLDRAMADDGILAQWVPTGRVLNSAAQVFPHIVTATVPQYNESVFMLASRSPLDVAPELLVERFLDHAASEFEPAQRARVSRFLGEWSPTCVNSGEVRRAVDPVLENRDLRPRDEYHFNNRAVPVDGVSTCARAADDSMQGG